MANAAVSTTSVAPDDGIDWHFKQVARGMLRGAVVPLLGAGANLSGRPAGFKYSGNQHDYLPSGRELARHLAQEFGYPASPDEQEKLDLLRVSQFVDVMEGMGELYLALHSVFDSDYRPGPLHEFLAGLQPILRDRGRGCQVILTTNYDDALERAFLAADEEYDLIMYVCPTPTEPAHFVHVPSGATEGVPILTANEYSDLGTNRAVILKMHGAVSRGETFDKDNYVITEDHYIDYLAHADVTNLLPAPILRRLHYSHFLFLGYAMGDWNLRVMLRRIWGAQPLEFKSWSIQLHPDELEKKFWADRNVTIFNRDLDDYIEKLRAALDERLEA